MEACQSCPVLCSDGLREGRICSHVPREGLCQHCGRHVNCCDGARSHQVGESGRCSSCGLSVMCIHCPGCGELGSQSHLGGVCSHDPKDGICRRCGCLISCCDGVHSHQFDENGRCSSCGLVEFRVRIRNRLGLHARPSGKVGSIANRYVAAISLVSEQYPELGCSNARVPFRVNMSGIGATRMIIRAKGPDALEAASHIAMYLETDFGDRD